MFSIVVYILTTKITPGIANLFKFAAPYIENMLAKVARLLSLVSKMIKSKDLKLWKRFADFCSL